MNETTESCLKHNGWSNDRRIEVDGILDDLRVHGWIIFKCGIDFISSFNDIGEFSYRIHGDIGFSSNALSFVFRYTTGIDWLDKALTLSQVIGVNLLPIGHQDLFEMFIGEDCCIYSIDADYLCLKVGNSLDESLDNLFLGQYVAEVPLP